MDGGRYFLFPFRYFSLKSLALSTVHGECDGCFKLNWSLKLGRDGVGKTVLVVGTADPSVCFLTKMRYSLSEITMLWKRMERRGGWSREPRPAGPGNGV